MGTTKLFSIICFSSSLMFMFGWRCDWCWYCMFQRVPSGLLQDTIELTDLFKFIIFRGSEGRVEQSHVIAQFVQIYHFPWVWGTATAQPCDWPICSNLPFSVGLEDGQSRAIWLPNLTEFTIFHGSGGQQRMGHDIAQFDRIYHFPWVWGTDRGDSRGDGESRHEKD